MRRLVAMLGALLLVVAVAPAPAAAAQTLTWTAGDSVTAYTTKPTQAVAGATTIVFENSAATGNTTGMPHTLTFDTTTEGYNHDVNLNILANPFDANNGRHEATITLTPGRYRYFCSIPGHISMVGELVVTDGGTTPDTTPPTVAAQAAGTRDGDGDYVGTATVTVTAADTGSGVDTIEYALDGAAFQPYTTPVVVTAVGSHTARFRATDKSGNVSAAGTLTFTVVAPEPDEDTTPPTVSAQVAGERDGQGNYLGTATATLTAADPDSGVARIEYSLDGGAFTAYGNPVVVGTAGMHMLHYRATDNAGNTSAEQMAHFTVVARDTSAPTVTVTVGGTRDADGAYVGLATVTVTSSEAARVEYALDAGAWTAYSAPVEIRGLGAHTVRARATDAAGNTSAETTATFTVVGSGTGACPAPDTRATVIIDGDDTGVRNYALSDGCTVNDRIAEHDDYADHAAFVRHVETVTAALVVGGTLTQRQRGTIVRAAARSAIGS